MKTASPALIALLGTRQFYSADLYQFNLVGGGVLRYTTGDQNIVYGGFTWLSGGSTGPYFDRKDNKAKCHWKIGVEVDTLVFDCIPGSSVVLGDPFLSAVTQGQFDGAEFTLYRAFMPTYGNVSAGVVTMFAGRVAEVDAGRSLATFSITSHLELLTQNLPRNLYQSGCLNTLYDIACTVNRASYAVNGTVQVASLNQITVASSLGADGYFNLGSIVFTSGSNAGLSRTVQFYGNTPTVTFHMVSPFPSIASAGDTFIAYPGCDKTTATCANKYGNLNNFRGFPYIPVPETAI